MRFGDRGFKALKPLSSMSKQRLALAVAAIAAAGLCLCLYLALVISHPSASSQTASGRAYILYIATTTSVKDTGLLDVLIPDFKRWAEERGYVIDVRYQAVGTGQALLMAARGDVDVVIVHSPPLEMLYLRNGTLRCRQVIAYNYFIIVGPKDDTAGIRGRNAVEAFRLIAEAGSKGRAIFVSRADRSGTNLKELELWRIAIGREPDPKRDSWYVAVGAGMGQTLLVADERSAYTLSDTGTWHVYKSSGKVTNLDVLVDRDPNLINVYSFGIAKLSEAALLMAEYMATRGLDVIGNYTIHGYAPFTPVRDYNDSIIMPFIFGSPCWRR